ITGLNVQSGKIERITKQTHSDITGSNDTPSDRERGTVEYYRGETQVVEEKVFDAPTFGIVEGPENRGYSNPETNVWTMPGSLFGGRIITDMSPN
mgnify:CR=1